VCDSDSGFCVLCEQMVYKTERGNARTLYALSICIKKSKWKSLSKFRYSDPQLMLPISKICTAKLIRFCGVILVSFGVIAKRHLQYVTFMQLILMYTHIDRPTYTQLHVAFVLVRVCDIGL
jgi:hypothetical protein